MKFFTWRNGPKWIAVAHAESVSQARERLLEEVGGLDGSCVVRAKAREIIAAEAPEIWNGINAEFALTDSAELEEADAENTRLRAAKARLAEALRNLCAEIEAVMAGEFGSDWADRFNPLYCMTEAAEASLASTDSLAWLEEERRKAAVAELRRLAREKTYQYSPENQWVPAMLNRRADELEGGRG